MFAIYPLKIYSTNSVGVVCLFCSGPWESLTSVVTETRWSDKKASKHSCTRHSLEPEANTSARRLNERELMVGRSKGAPPGAPQRASTRERQTTVRKVKMS